MQEAPTWVNVAHDQRGQAQRHRAGASGGFFKAGPRYRTRRDGRDDLLLLVTQGGGGLLRHEGSSFEVGPRTALLYAQHAAQDYGTDPAHGTWLFRYCHVMPLPHWWAARDWPGPWPGVGVIAIDDDKAWTELDRALRQINEVAVSTQVTSEALAMNAAEAALLWCRSRDTSAGRVIDQRVRRAIEHAQRNIDRRVTVTELADAASLSVPRLNVLFREQLGTSPGNYAELLRLEHAASLLNSTGLSIKEIASATGFHDQAHFSKRFRRCFGAPPSARRVR